MLHAAMPQRCAYEQRKSAATIYSSLLLLFAIRDVYSRSSPDTARYFVL